MASKKKLLKKLIRRVVGEIGIDGNQAFRYHRVPGVGGMAQTYEVENCNSKCRFAMKEPHPEFVDRTDLFEPEARVLGILKHPGIVKGLWLGRLADGISYYLMELLEGMTLRAALKASGKLEVYEACNIASQYLTAIAHAHGANVVHRDIKPENIFLHQEPGFLSIVKILDFGVVKLTGLPTKKGVVVGTPFYASMEQLLGLLDIGPKSDVYSCAVVLFEMLTGVTPFHQYGYGASHEGMLKTLYIKAPLLSEFGDFPLRLVALLARALDKDSEKRPTAIEFALELRAILRALPQPIDPNALSTEELMVLRTANQPPVLETVFESPTIPDGGLVARMKEVREELGISSDDDAESSDEPAAAPDVDRNAPTRTRVQSVARPDPDAQGPNGTPVLPLPNPNLPATTPDARPMADRVSAYAPALPSQGSQAVSNTPPEDMYLDVENLGHGEVERLLSDSHVRPIAPPEVRPSKQVLEIGGSGVHSVPPRNATAIRDVRGVAAAILVHNGCTPTDHGAVSAETAPIAPGHHRPLRPVQRHCGWLRGGWTDRAGHHVPAAHVPSRRPPGNRLIAARRYVRRRCCTLRRSDRASRARAHRCTAPRDSRRGGGITHRIGFYRRATPNQARGARFTPSLQTPSITTTPFCFRFDGLPSLRFLKMHQDNNE